MKPAVPSRTECCLWLPSLPPPYISLLSSLVPILPFLLLRSGMIYQLSFTEYNLVVLSTLYLFCSLGVVSIKPAVPSRMGSCMWFPSLPPPYISQLSCFVPILPLLLLRSGVIFTKILKPILCSKSKNYY